MFNILFEKLLKYLKTQYFISADRKIPEYIDTYGKYRSRLLYLMDWFDICYELLKV